MADLFFCLLSQLLVSCKRYFSCKMMVGCKALGGTGWVNPINTLLDVVVACAAVVVVVVVVVAVVSLRLQDDDRVVDPEVTCTAIHAKL